MKTMLEILIRLEEMRGCCQRTRHNPQLTDWEKAAASSHKLIVRECLPPEVLAHYDRMKTIEGTMKGCPEVFAMAVLVSTWRSLLPAGRRKLAAHFTTPTPARAASSAKRKARHPKSPVRGKTLPGVRSLRNGARRSKAVVAQAVDTGKAARR
jgi:hypothetical protein